LALPHLKAGDSYRTHLLDASNNSFAATNQRTKWQMGSISSQVSLPANDADKEEEYHKIAENRKRKKKKEFESIPL
jgi:hypothetical protein